MAGSTGLAGIIGTWVAVSLALIALFGILTPISLIRRARSERHIALSKIEHGSNKIVHSGIKIPLLPVIARKIHAPDLQAPPELTGHVLGRDDTILDRNPSGTGWVIFARTLKAYNIAQHPKGTLRIYQTQSWLPVHRLWILTVRLLGRYAHCPDRGRLIYTPPPGRIDQRGLGSSDRNALYSITGVVRYRAPEGFGDVEQDFGQIYFSSHDSETQGSFEPNLISLADLFWSCMGCVRLPDGRVFDISREQVTRQRY